MRSTSDREVVTRLDKAAWSSWKHFHVRVALWSLAIMVCFFASRTQAQSQDDEYRVKAAFIYHFAQLVNWPVDTASNAGRQLVLCTIGSDPFQGKLENIVEGKQVGALILHVHHIKQIAQGLRGCQILFVGKEEARHLPALLAMVQNLPVLTVGESDAFIRDGGMISFTLDEGKIRFEINLDAARQAQLKISSRLLLLAQKVIGNSGTGK